MKSILAAGAVVLLAGCATSFKPWKLSDVREGMSRNEVVSVLGDPDSTEIRNGAEYLYYTYQEESRGSGWSDAMNETMERKAEELTRILSETRYEVVMVDGKLINYKEITD
ncbi:outer membrane protein assembly factor BamE domain-containing protein [Pontiella agarivorans]|uniref:Outer membrane protein assembly factor BamE n=1 Tax=Pontiella agarivorans TaxID=3038953 RepID=A0ABU5MXA1_9BACT|nr:outer membrane protein assembly factor BamE [Pontiella agarivorans]MDZ8118833.1 outer membrane protein assembly factor BamE [Pontiella agarivorans]